MADPAPVEILNPNATTPVLLIADHSGRAVPSALTDATGSLGVTEVVVSQHIGWDIGVDGITGQMAARLNATAVLATYSRLLIDLNRPLGDPESIPEASDGIVIPANRNLSARDLETRAQNYFWPYHTAVDRELARIKRAGEIPVLVAIHSFTPALMSSGAPRPWHIGLLASRDVRLSDALHSQLRQHDDLVIGVNEPYSGVTHGYCLKLHGLAQGLAHIEIEIRQDLIADDAGQSRWADLLAGALRPILADRALRAIKHY